MGHSRIHDALDVFIVRVTNICIVSFVLSEDQERAAGRAVDIGIQLGVTRDIKHFELLLVRGNYEVNASCRCPPRHNSGRYEGGNVECDSSGESEVDDGHEQRGRG